MSDAADTDRPPKARVGRRWKVVAGLTAPAVVVAVLGWFWWQSLIPDTYSVMDMGYADYGGGPSTGPDMHGMSGHQVSVTSLVGPDRPADVSVTLVARAETITLGDNLRVDGFTLNHLSPGPEIRVSEGQLLEVTLVNESVPDGVALHWHGVDVPNGEDGVAGVTQDAVEEGEQHIYRFVAEDPGTYWYHSHQVSDEQVRKGLFGPLVITPAPSDAPTLAETLAVVHSYSGYRTVNGQNGEQRFEAPTGQPTVVRVVNTNNGPLRTWLSGASYQVLAVDGRNVNEPTPVEDQAIVVPAGGRADLEVVPPSDGSGVRINFGGGTSLVVGPSSSNAPETEDPKNDLDLLSYGSPAPLGFDPSQATRHFEYRIGRRLGFFDGKPGFWWSINGHLYPDVPMFMVDEGDIVEMTIKNSSGQVHPMHLHGHHAVVLSRNGEAASGSPWWVDSLEVQDDETFVIAFVADNPGIWMDHCHNLPHASQGLVTHLMYTNVTTPFVIGGKLHNKPE